MNFKEYVANDIPNTFINDSEFAEIVSINNTDVYVVEDSDKLLYRIKKDFDGLVVGDVLFFISKEEYAKIPMLMNPPTANQAINYKGIASTIVNVAENMGVYEIIIQKVGGY